VPRLRLRLKVSGTALYLGTSEGFSPETGRAQPRQNFAQYRLMKPEFFAPANPRGTPNQRPGESRDPPINRLTG